MSTSNVSTVVALLLLPTLLYVVYYLATGCLHLAKFMQHTLLLVSLRMLPENYLNVKISYITQNNVIEIIARYNLKYKHLFFFKPMFP